MSRLVLFPRVLERSLWSRRVAEACETGSMRAVIRMLQSLRLSTALHIGRALFMRFGPRSRLHDDLKANLAVLYPYATLPEIERRARDTWGWAGVTAAELAHARELADPSRTRIEFDVSEDVDRVLRTLGQPAVLATAHVGPWLLGNLIATPWGFPLTTAVPEVENRWLDRFLQDALRALPVHNVSRANRTSTLSREITRGHKIFLAIDGWNDAGHNVTLFGEPMRLDPTPAHLAVHHNVPLIPLHTERLAAGGYRITARRVLMPDRMLSSETERARLLTEGFAAEFERWLRAHSQQWLCLTPRWADQSMWEALTRTADQTPLPPPLPRPPRQGARHRDLV